MDLYINPITVSFLSQAMILVCLGAYFFFAHWVPRRQPFDLYFSLSIFFHFVYTVFAFGEHAFYSGWDVVCLFTQDGALFWGAIFFVLSAYMYSPKSGLWKKEKAYVLLFFTAFFVQEIFVYWERYYSIFALKLVFWRDTYTQLCLPLTYLWALVVYYRQSLTPRKKSNARGFLKWLFNTPIDRERRAARSFAWTAVIIGFVAIIGTAGDDFIPEMIQTPLISIGVMVSILSLELTYINNISENSSYKTKFLGVSMVVFLIAISLTNWSVTMRAVHDLLANPDELHNAMNQPIQDGSGYRFELTPLEHAEGIDDVDYQDSNFVYKLTNLHEARSFRKGTIIQEDYSQAIQLHFSFNFFDRSYTQIYPYNRGAILFEPGIAGADMRWRYGERPMIVPALTRVSFHDHNIESPTSMMTWQANGDEVIISWFMDAEESPVKKDIEFHVVLTHSAIEWHFVKFPLVNEPPLGQIEIPVWFSGLLPGPLNEKGYSAPENLVLENYDTHWIKPTGFVQDNALFGKEFIHSYSQPFAFLSLGGGVLVVWLMNIFINKNISTPLNELQVALGQLNQGNLGVRAKALFPDEFGFFARTFNRMADSIQNNTKALELEHERLEQQVISRKLELKKQIRERSQIVQALKLNERKMSTLLNNINGVAYKRSSRHGKFPFAFVRGRCLQMTGLAPEEFFNSGGLRFDDHINFQDRVFFGAELSRCVEEKRTLALRYKFTKPTGENCCFWDQARPVFDQSGAFRFFEGLITDVTEESEAEESLEIAKAAAETANDAKNVFLNHMSHEIRTPLNAVLGYSQILLRDSGLPGNYREPVHMIEASGSHLIALIDDILDFSKIESGLIELRESAFDLGAVCKVLDGWFSDRCALQNIRWRSEMPESNRWFVTGDESKLRQALLNLLSNAVKFTSEGEVSFRVFQPLKRRDIWRFEIQDTGYGISEEAHQIIFEPFVQHEAGFQKGGTGLGLAIASRHVELMGGRLGLSSKLGVGSTFYFEIPLPNLVQGGEPHLEKSTFSNSRYSEEATVEGFKKLPFGVHLNALIVDDIEVNRDVISEALKQMGVRAWQVKDGQSAVDFTTAKGEGLDLIFMDIRMPRLNGVDAMKEIRRRLPGAKPFIVAFSASTLGQEKQDFIEAGFDEFLAKPFRFQDLESIIEKVIGKSLIVDTEILKNNGSEMSPVCADEGTQDQEKFAVSDEMRTSLLAAAENGQATELDQLLSQLSMSGPGAEAWVHHQRKLVQNLDLMKLAELIRDL